MCRTGGLGFAGGARSLKVSQATKDRSRPLPQRTAFPGSELVTMDGVGGVLPGDAIIKKMKEVQIIGVK